MMHLEIGERYSVIPFEEAKKKVPSYTISNDSILAIDKNQWNDLVRFGVIIQKILGNFVVVNCTSDVDMKVFILPNNFLK